MASRTDHSWNLRIGLCSDPQYAVQSHKGSSAFNDDEPSSQRTAYPHRSRSRHPEGEMRPAIQHKLSAILAAVILTQVIACNDPAAVDSAGSDTSTVNPPPP